jgi:hypothetical protein
VVWAANHPPSAGDQTGATSEDMPVAISLAANDPDGDALSYAIVGTPAHGTLAGAAPALVYTPAGDFYGTDAFTFKASDGQSDSNLATVSITVTPVNDPPLAAAQALSVAEDTPLGIVLLASDVDGDALLYTIVTPPVHGTLAGVAPAFKAGDGMLESNVVEMLVRVDPVNDAPVAADQSLQAVMGVATDIQLTATDVDGDALAYNLVTSPTHGTLTGAPPNLVYTSVSDYLGPDSFSFRVGDGELDSNLAVVSLDVVPEANHAPTCAGAHSDQARLWPPNHKMKEIRVLGVTDQDGDPVTIQASGIWQDEPINGVGDGDRAPDGTRAPIQVRSERSGPGNGRVYRIDFTAADDQMATCTGSVMVCVPHDNGGTCVDDGSVHDSTQN